MRRKRTEWLAPGRVELALVGFGPVAQRFVELLVTRRQELDAHYGLRWTIVGVTTRQHGTALAQSGLSVRDLLARVREGSIDDLHDTDAGPIPPDGVAFVRQVAAVRARGGREAGRLVMVENTPLGLDDGQPGVAHVRAAFAVGADVITANKGPAAFAYHVLRDEAVAAGCTWLFEGSVLDGLPVFSLLRDSLPVVQVKGFRGVVNTTTNHILSAMENGGEVSDALREMRQAGVTENDPAIDFDGWDAATKAAVLANVLMGTDLVPHDVEREGLDQTTGARVRDACARGKRIKLVASATRHLDRVAVSVRLKELPADDPLARLHGTAKGLILDTDLLGRIELCKSESSVAHTAYALLSDLVTLHRTPVHHE